MEGLLGITYRCNARCKMCNIWKFPTKKEEEVKVEDLEKLPRMRFTNITGGEPFLRDDIEEIIYILKKKAKRIVIRFPKICKSFDSQTKISPKEIKILE